MKYELKLRTATGFATSGPFVVTAAASSPSFSSITIKTCTRKWHVTQPHEGARQNSSADAQCRSPIFEIFSSLKRKNETALREES